VSTKKNGVILIIKDTGVGMNPDQVSRLGTPYYSTKDKGTGLGTMVSFSILKAMMGKVEVKSELGKGTDGPLSIEWTHKTERITTQVGTYAQTG
jgi:two-component system sporulation sensor kinase B